MNEEKKKKNVLTLQIDLDETDFIEVENYDDYGVQFCLTDAVKNAIEAEIRRSVITVITNEYNKELYKKFDKDILSKDAELLSQKYIDDEFKKYIKNGVVNKGDKYEEKPIQEYLDDVFTKGTDPIKKSFKKMLDEKASEVVKEVRDRYDMLFAANIITKLNEQSMLKPGVFESLMSSTNDKK